MHGQHEELDAALAEMTAEMSESTKVLRAIVEGEKILAMRDRTSVLADVIPTIDAAFLSAREIYAASQRREIDEERQEERLAAEETAKELVGQMVDQAEKEAAQKEQPGHQRSSGAGLAVQDAFTAASPAMVTAQNWSGAVASSGELCFFTRSIRQILSWRGVNQTEPDPHTRATRRSGDL